MNDLALWNELTRRDQRIMIKLFGGGSSHGDGPIETVNLTRLGLIRFRLTDASLLFESSNAATGCGLRCIAPPIPARD